MASPFQSHKRPDKLGLNQYALLSTTLKLIESSGVFTWLESVTYLKGQITAASILTAITPPTPHSAMRLVFP